MKKIAIIGSGNVAFHLSRALKETDYEIQMINPRSLDGLSDDFDLILIAVTDTIIEEISGKIADKLVRFNGIVTHTAGTVEMKVFAKYFDNYGVIYPLQTFNKDLEISNYRQIPVFIEGNSKETVDKIYKIISNKFENCVQYSSEQRKTLHLASVFACNFVNAMYSVSEEILNDNDIPYEYIKPLIEYTCFKAIRNNPSDIQTGPAKRGDIGVIKAHIKELADKPEILNLYQTITSFLLKKYGHE